MSRRAWLTGLFVLLLALGGFLLTRASPTPPSAPPAAEAARPKASRSGDPDGSTSPREAAPRRPAAEPMQARARRDALRDRIRARMAARAADRVDAASPRDRAAPPDDATEPSATGGLTNRMGPGTEALAAAVNQEFLPLAQECIDAALERQPALRGMLAVSIDAIGDEDVGAVIEDVDFPETNEVRDAELLECIRETSLSIALPPTPAGGSTSFMVTMPIGESNADAPD